MNLLAQQTASGTEHPKLACYTDVLGGCVLVTAAVVMVGWWLDVAAFKSVLPGRVAMQFNTALGLFLAGLALRGAARCRSARWRVVGRVCAGLVTIMGALTLVEYFFGLETGLAGFFFRENPAAADTSYPGRMSPQTAASFFLFGLSFLSSSSHRRWLQAGAQMLLAGIALIALMALAGQLYGALYFYGVSRVTGMAIHTALAFLALSAGLFCAQHEDGPSTVFFSDTSGGMIARRLLPATVLVPLLLGWMRVLGQEAGLYDTAAGVALMTTGSIVVFAVLIGLTARVLHRVDLSRREAQTARLHTEAALRESEERFRLVEAAPNAMVMVDAAGQITLVNAQAEMLFGYPRVELLGQPMEMLVPARYRAAHPGHRAGFMAAPHARAMGAGRDLTGLRKDGSEVPIEIGLNPIHTPTGIFVLASIIDITERKHAEATLRASEERFRLVVEASPNAKLIVDAAGRITLVNGQVEQLFGYSRAELLGQPMEMLVPARYRAAHPGHRAGFMAAPHARSMGAGRDLTGLRKDGSEVPIEIGLNPIHTPEGVLVLASIIDITERKAAEDRLKAHLHEKEVLLQEIHHRVKNNLQVVSSLIGLQADAVQHPEARTALTNSRNRIQAIARVHEHLYQSADLASLDFTIYLRELAVEVFHLYQPTHGSRIQLGFEVEDVRLDINQAIPCALITNELLVNALKYAFPGERSGLVTLTLQHAPGGRVRLAVADDGVGLPPGFDWRASASLGLELVQTLARQIRADVAVETSPGTRFDLTFPLSTVKLTKPT